MSDAPMCPYCSVPARLTDSAVVYGGRSYGDIWLCTNFPECDARCGARDGRPLGTLAREDLRELRKQCHARFDPLWRDGLLSRNEAYRRLRRVMGLPANVCHIAMFDEAQCLALIEQVEQIATWEGDR